MRAIFTSFVISLLQYLGTAIGGVLVYFSTAIWKRARERRRIKNVNGDGGVIDRKIYAILTELRVRLGASRVYLCKFLNGHYYDDGQSLQKYNRTHESCAPGVSEETDRYTNVLKTRVPEEMRLVVEPGASFDQTGSMEDGTFRRWLVSSNIGAVARIAVRRGKGEDKQILAFIGVDWNNHDDGTPIKEPPNFAELLMTAAGTIEQIMDQQILGK